jgi:hypothetical protein
MVGDVLSFNRQGIVEKLSNAKQNRGWQDLNLKPVEVGTTAVVEVVPILDG